jgi:ferredoxin--NADP+ reductase
MRKTRNIETLKGFAANLPGSKPVTVHFLFDMPTTEIRAGEFDLVVSCIGYGGAALPEGDGVFPVGWARRGPSGTIPTNRADSHAVAQQVLAWLKDRAPKGGVDALPPAVDAAGWHRIDKAEIEAGAARGRPRVKLTDWESLLKVARG